MRASWLLCLGIAACAATPAAAPVPQRYVPIHQSPSKALYICPAASKRPPPPPRIRTTASVILWAIALDKALAETTAALSTCSHHAKALGEWIDDNATTVYEPVPPPPPTIGQAP